MGKQRLSRKRRLIIHGDTAERCRKGFPGGPDHMNFNPNELMIPRQTIGSEQFFIE
jgi:hypothetical protein